VVNVTSRLFYPRERPSTQCVGHWVGPKAGLDRCGKISPPTGIQSPTVQPVASRYTDWANQARTKAVVGTSNSTWRLSAADDYQLSPIQWTPDLMTECHSNNTHSCYEFLSVESPDNIRPNRTKLANSTSGEVTDSADTHRPGRHCNTLSPMDINNRHFLKTPHPAFFPTGRIRWQHFAILQPVGRDPHQCHH